MSYLFDPLTPHAGQLPDNPYGARAQPTDLPELVVRLQGRRPRRAAGRKFIAALRVFSHLANVGDAKSLVIPPASTTHARMSDEALAAAGTGAGTIRLSIGLEDSGDLIDDIDRGLNAATRD